MKIFLGIALLALSTPIMAQEESREQHAAHEHKEHAAKIAGKAIMGAANMVSGTAKAMREHCDHAGKEEASAHCAGHCDEKGCCSGDDCQKDCCKDKPKACDPTVDCCKEIPLGLGGE